MGALLSECFALAGAMSLSSLLVGSAKVDKELDSLFKSHVPIHQTIPTDVTLAKRKRTTTRDDDSISPKRLKSVPKTEVERSDEKKVSTSLKPFKTKSQRSKKAPSPQSDEDDTEKASLQGKDEAMNGKESDEGDESTNDQPLIHETLQRKTKKSHPGPKQKYTPPEETPELRDQRTVFIGNLPLQVAQKKSAQKQLNRHVLSFIPDAKIEATRFRSIPFQAPTSKLPTADDENQTSKTTTSKQVRAHDRERISTWKSRAEAANPEEEELKNDEKKYLKSNEKKRIAFINQEFHSTADTINAYMVFAHPTPVEDRPSNLPPLKPTMDPYKAALAAAEKCDGTLFMERMIRVDIAGKNAPISAKPTGTADTDPKLSIFVGNLDFATKEEDLRVFFEGVVHAERGLRSDHETAQDDNSHAQDSESQAKKLNTWVTRVRIVRDKETQLGKGFAYVQFADRECVDEILALEQDKLKFAKRKLRVQRCKGGVASVMKRPAKDQKTVQKRTSGPSETIVIPKGDPHLGERLAHLSKDARKQIKSNDEDRLARRLAKKKARMAMGNKADIKSKDRERVRKNFVAGKPKAGIKEKKGRVRSDKAISKRNTKK